MITVVMGPPASGKSTYVQANRKPGDVVIDFDALSQALGATIPHDRPEPIAQVTFAARTAAIARIFDGIDADAWIIQTNLNADAIERWGEGGARFVVIDPGRDVVEEQARADGRPASSMQVIADWYASPPTIPDQYKKEAQVRTKAFQTDVKAVDVAALEAGEFIGYAAIFDNVDTYGDVIRKGAFTETLATYGEAGAGIPCYWGHRMDDPLMNIGSTISAVEDERGLKVHVALDLETEQGRHTHKLIKTGRVAQMSFAYDILDASWAEVDGMDVLELRKLRLHEVSVVPIGANQDTELLAVKGGAVIKTTPEPGAEVEQEPTEEPAEDPATGNAEVKAANVRALIALAEHGLGH